MNLDILKEKFDVLCEHIEGYLTSVTYEEAKVKVASESELPVDVYSTNAVETDIFLFARDTTSNCDVIVEMDEAWFGLLSSIMLGIEEKSFNDVTRDLLMKFATELYELLQKNMQETDGAVQLEKIRVLTRAQLLKELGHTAYFKLSFDVHGLADDVVRAGFLIGDPARLKADEVEEQPEASKGEVHKNGDSKSNGNATAANGNGSANGQHQEIDPDDIIAGTRVEFADFGEANAIFEELDGTNIDLLKDVNMDVSVELGKIEMSLGKVLQLTKGSVLELDKLAGEPVDVLVNGHRIAQGEVVVIDEHFGVRISNLVTTRERLAKLK